MIKYFYCPECNSITSALVDSIINTNDPRVFYHVLLNRQCECGSTMEEIDSNIIITIKNLNDAKLKTVYSCEGHIGIDKDTNEVVEYSNAYIMFDETVSQFILKSIVAAYPLPENWVIDEGIDSLSFKYENNCVCIRYIGLDDVLKISLRDFIETKHKYLYDIEQWSKNILADSGKVFEIERV